MFSTLSHPYPQNSTNALFSICQIHKDLVESLFWLRVCRPLVKNCKAASLACHVSLGAGQTPDPCFMLLLFIDPFVEQSSQLLGFLSFFPPPSVPSVDKYSLIPKIAWNGTINISTSVHGKRKV